MAEALVYLVIKKASFLLAGEVVKALASQLGKEASLLIEAESSIKQIKSEFEVMQGFLIQVQNRERIGEAGEAWLKQIRELACEVEDTIDDYAYLTNEQHTGLTGFLKKSLHKSKTIIDLHNMATRLKQIETRLRNLSEMKYRYSINITGESNDLNCSGSTQRNVAGYSYLMDQDDLIGIGEERKQLIQWLTEERPECTTISVWGMGGLGKTSLVRNVYASMDIKRSTSLTRQFDCHAWISVSQKYEVNDILRRIIKEVSVTKDDIPPNMGSMDRKELVDFLKETLHGKKCLIIFDDVWSRDDWFPIVGSFLSNNSGSKVVITTRIMDVARLATGGRVINLQCLQEEEAWNLFCRRAFCNEENKRCPDVLEKWGKLITKKCRGLPLAIVAIGSLLCYSTKDEIEWKKFYERFGWEMDNSTEINWIANILNLSYSQLPVYLKNCFLYCSIFPEAYLLKRKRLVRLWIAEGFIDEKGSQTLEEVAEYYLNELIQRCMLQVVQRNEFGRVKSCQMHDLVRELTLTVISAKENFCLIYDNPESAMSCERARRLSVHCITRGTHLGNDLPRLRSLVVFDRTQPLPSLMSALSYSSRFLRVLDLRDAMIERVPDEVGVLFNLHYLGLRRTKVKELPKSLGKLTNLQTLDLLSSKIEKLPDVTKLRNLRNLFADRINGPTGRAFGALGGVGAPRGLYNLRQLQTLQSVEAGRDLLWQLVKLTQLRSLIITKLRGKHCTELWACIADMQCLSKLRVYARDEEEVLLLQGFNPQTQHLQKLALHGRLEGGIVPLTYCPSLGNTLQLLTLGWSGLREDPLPYLSRFSKLTCLRLTNAYDGQELRFCAGWFPTLVRLLLIGLKQLGHIEIERGSMENLRRLQLVGLRKLKSIPRGIEFLTSLRELSLVELSTELKETLQEGKVDRIRHIPETHWRD